MFKIIQNSRNVLKAINSLPAKYQVQSRTFLSQAYYCQEVWDHRLNSSILERVKPVELFTELDQRYHKSGQISAIDVDIFVNAVRDETYIEELLDLVHKLRLSADTTNSLESTSHAVVRYLLGHGKHQDLLNVLDDRLNYGVFIDYYTANILMDTFWKNKSYSSGARIASQLMLQEETEHPLSNSLSLLHCYKYLENPGDWPLPVLPEEPEEEVKIRVKYLRNPYDDEHFDLRDPNRIVGKTIAVCTKHRSDPVGKSLNILGWALFSKEDKVLSALKECKEGQITLIKEIIDLIPEGELKNVVSEMRAESVDVENHLQRAVDEAIQNTSEFDIAEQCKIFEKWQEDRKTALKEQMHRLSVAKRLESIEDVKKALQEKERRLWFFENEEQIELRIEEFQEKQKEKELSMKKTKKKASKIDEGYIPPEITKRVN